MSSGAGMIKRDPEHDARWVALILPVVAVLWLGELAGPLTQLLSVRKSESAIHVAIALAGVAAFVGLYLWVVVDAIRTRAGTLRRGSGEVLTWVPAVLMATVAVLLSMAYGPAWMALFVFAAVGSALRLRPRHAVWAILALTLVAGAIGLAYGNSPADLAQGTLLVGGISASVATVDYSIRTTRELRAARAEIAHLAVAEERLRFARDLHDLLGHSLSLVALKCDLADQLAAGGALEPARREIQEAAGVTRQALRDVRETVAGYRRPTLAEELRGAREMLTAAGIGCHLEGESGRLPAEAEGALAWAVREGVTNVIRHSRAQRCVIRVRRTADRVELEVVDDGRGPGAEVGTEQAESRRTGGSGLAGLAERLSAVGGAAQSGADAAGGFRLAAWVPLVREQAP